MNKYQILSTLTLLILFTGSLVTAEPIRVKTSELTHFVGTYDAVTNSFSSHEILNWDEQDPTAYHNAIKKFPDKEGTYYCIAPWYNEMAQAICIFKARNVVYAGMVDMKLSYSVDAIVTKWEYVGDSLELVCVGKNFPNMGSAPNIDGVFILPDSSHFLVVRSAGGDDRDIWRRYGFFLEDDNCTWLEVYNFESLTSPFEEEYTEGWVIVEDADAPYYKLKVVTRKNSPIGNPNNDGSFSHRPVSQDSTYIDFWEEVKKVRQ